MSLYFSQALWLHLGLLTQWFLLVLLEFTVTLKFWYPRLSSLFTISGIPQSSHLRCSIFANLGKTDSISFISLIRHLPHGAGYRIWGGESGRRYCFPVRVVRVLTHGFGGRTFTKSKYCGPGPQTTKLSADLWPPVNAAAAAALT